MEGEHTPGPWHTSPAADLHRVGVYAGRHQEAIICDVSAEDVSDGQCEANARLISVAPDLLEACEAAMTFINRNVPISAPDGNRVVGLLRVAIVKATQAV